MADVKFERSLAEQIVSLANADDAEPPSELTGSTPVTLSPFLYAIQNNQKPSGVPAGAFEGVPAAALHNTSVQERLEGTQHPSPTSQRTLNSADKAALKAQDSPRASDDVHDPDDAECELHRSSSAAARRLRARTSSKWSKEESIYISSPDMSDDQSEGRRSTKRKIEEIDLEAIKDPVKRRLEKQKAKNRRTAAKSRERKKEQQAWLETENERLSAEVQELRDQLHLRDLEIQELARAQDIAYAASGGVASHKFLLQILSGSSNPPE